VLIRDEIVGFASLGPRDFDGEEERVGELYAIYVLPDIQGRGAGRALMAEAVSRLRYDGFREAVLWVFEDNPRTRRFYERGGWGTDGGRKDETWLGTTSPAVRYRLVLEPGGE
jgi:ribosomal protein S18 acetylase RimI-like enzyme